jgi:hypothetical protein
MDDRDQIFIEKANSLLERAEKIHKGSLNSLDCVGKKINGDFDEIICDAVHLIYSYDKDIPILKNVLDYTSIRVSIKDAEHALKYVIHYINEIKVG